MKHFLKNKLSVFTENNQYTIVYLIYSLSTLPEHFSLLLLHA